MGYRLDKGGHIDRSQAIHFRWNGRRLAAFAGDTVASALIVQMVFWMRRIDDSMSARLFSIWRCFESSMLVRATARRRFSTCSWLAIMMRLVCASRSVRERTASTALSSRSCASLSCFSALASASWVSFRRWSS